ncbi:hypothetical protein F383_12956 [Gossypium arboreum]|uniref:Uncharacterized protein n=1 Tax=Gossypium arboreum TaxID=29729 RepID=A0A0B0NDV1_GOSAR|nr:hypothetical protein F383_12956 [Gossypium arboreum]
MLPVKYLWQKLNPHRLAARHPIVVYEEHVITRWRNVAIHGSLKNNVVCIWGNIFVKFHNSQLNQSLIHGDPMGHKRR